MSRMSKRWVVAGRPIGRPLQESDFRFEEAPLPALAEGQVVVRVCYLGFEPAIKGWMESKGKRAISEIGEPIFSFGVGEVVESNSPRLQPGDFVVGPMRWQDYLIAPGHTLEKIDRDEWLTAHLGVAGISGFTAYFGLEKIGRPFPGDLAVVTSAAGAVGAAACQILKLAGCRVIGVAGGPEKCGWLVGELGIDAAIDYKTEDVGEALDRLAPEGVDLMFDNVGGDQLNQVLGRLAYGGRVVLCGGISRYESASPTGPANYFSLVPQHGTMSGFIAGTYAAEFPVARARLLRWLREGRIHSKIDVTVGLENGPEALMRIFVGANFGKQALEVAKP